MSLSSDEYDVDESFLDSYLPSLEPEPPEPPTERPRTRGECVGGYRPCPFVSCRHHLMLDVRPNGQLKQNFESLDEMPETCSLDVADRVEESTPLEKLGELLGISKQVMHVFHERQIERLRSSKTLRALDDRQIDGLLRRPKLRVIYSDRANEVHERIERMRGEEFGTKRRAAR